MSSFNPILSLLQALTFFPKGASQEDVILHVKPDSTSNIKSLKQGFFHAKADGLIYARTSYGERYWHLTEKGKAHLQGKQLQLSQPAEKITKEDVDKAIYQFGKTSPFDNYYQEAILANKRLDFMIDNACWIQSTKTDAGGIAYQLWTQNEDEEFYTLHSPTEFFKTQRDAIDAAIEFNKA